MRTMLRGVRWSGSVVGLLLAALLVHEVWRSNAAEARFPRHGELVQAGPVKLHYRAAGQGQSIVLLHGASSNLREFEGNLFEALSREGRVLSFDRPGYGYSERPRDWPDPARQAGLLHAALQRLGVERPVLVGHSWSGSLVLAYALAHPEHTRAVVVLAGGTHPWEGGVAWHVQLARTPVLGEVFARTLVPALAPLLTPAALDHVFWPERVPVDYTRHAGLELALRPRTFRASAEDVGQLSDFLRRQAPLYAGLRVPVLHISGTHDHVVPAWNHAARMLMQTERAEVRLLPGAGHGLHHTRTAEITALVSDFMATHP